jgi:hypothetical protein
MHAIRSLMQLIARRATGVSANLRKFAAVGFGSAFCTPVVLKGAKIEFIPRGVTAVFRSPTLSADAATPATRSHISLTAAPKPIPISLLNARGATVGSRLVYITSPVLFKVLNP